MAKSAYALQFLGSTTTEFQSLIWKTSAPPKCKQFAWLAIQNRLWTSDRLQARGWPNQALCPLYRQAPESVMHLLAECKFSRRVWQSMADWVGCAPLRPLYWPVCHDIEEWWRIVCYSGHLPRRATASMVILITWEIWIERNARIFKRRFSSPLDLVLKIREEGRAWTLAEGKYWEQLIPL